MDRRYYVYILASEARELYVGMTNDVHKRVAQHRRKFHPTSQTAEHQIFRLVYCETTEDVLAAIRREKQIKTWNRRRKLELIEQANPSWQDLAEGI